MSAKCGVPISRSATLALAMGITGDATYRRDAYLPFPGTLLAQEDTLVEHQTHHAC